MRTGKNRKTVCRAWMSAAVIALGILAAGCANEMKSSEESSIQIGENQRLATVMVREISGNQMTVMEVDNNDMEGGQGDAMQFAGEIGGEGGEYDIIEAGENDYTGELPGGTEEPHSPDLTNETAMAPGIETEDESADGLQEVNTLTKIQIPVGIAVYTAEGALTTMASISTGSLIQILFEMNEEGVEVPVEIRMQ